MKNGFEMKKTFAILAAGLLLTCGTLRAGGTESPSDARIEAIIGACSEIRSMKCDFRQIRRVPLMEGDQVSKGRMLYIQPSKLKWAYTEPFAYSLDVDGETVTVDGSEMQADRSRMFQGIAGVIMGCMSGQCLKDSRMFKVSMSDADGLWVATMVPVRRDMKKMFQRMVLSFSSETGLLEKIEMEEVGGGSTVIEIENVQLNGNYEAEW